MAGLSGRRPRVPGGRAAAETPTSRRVKSRTMGPSLNTSQRGQSLLLPAGCHRAPEAPLCLSTSLMTSCHFATSPPGHLPRQEANCGAQTWDIQAAGPPRPNACAGDTGANPSPKSQGLVLQAAAWRLPPGAQHGAGWAPKEPSHRAWRSPLPGGIAGELEHNARATRQRAGAWGTSEVPGGGWDDAKGGSLCSVTCNQQILGCSLQC